MQHHIFNAPSEQGYAFRLDPFFIVRWGVHVTCEIISCALPYKTNGMYFHNELSVSFMVVQKSRKRQDGNSGGQWVFLSLDLVQWTVSLLHSRDSEHFLLLVTSTKERAGYSQLNCWSTWAGRPPQLRTSVSIKKDGSDVSTTQELFYNTENEARKALTSTDPQLVQKFPKIFKAVGFLTFWG